MSQVARKTPPLVWLVVALAVVALVGGVFAFRTHQVRARDTTAQERYGAVQQAAADEVLALLNFDYRDPQATIDKVSAGATGDFGSELVAATKPLRDLTAQARSTMAGDVHWVGVVDVDPDSATVIVAADGRVTNTLTGATPVLKPFRIKVLLVREGDRWLTSGLDFLKVDL